MPVDADLILFWAKKLTAVAMLPPLGPMLLILVGLWRGRVGLPLIWLSLAASWFFSAPMTVGWLLAGLERSTPLQRDELRRAGAIVILAGGQRRFAPEFGGATVNSYSLERIRYGARLARASGLPVLVTGGAIREEVPEAELMREALVADFGVTPRWVEREARDTRENADNSARLLAEDGIHTIALVTHAAHMPRARKAFEHAGLAVVEAPTAWQGGPQEDEFDPLDLLPTPRDALSGWYAAHEWLGQLAYRLEAAR